MQIEPHIIFNARRAQKERKRHGAQISLSLSVYIYTHACMYPCVFAHLSSGAKSASTSPSLRVPRKVGEHSRFCSRGLSVFYQQTGLWRRRKDHHHRSKAENVFVWRFVRSFVLLSFVDTQRLFSFSLSNPIVIQNRRERAKESYRRSRKSSTRTSTSEAWWTSTLRRKIRKSLRSGQSCWRFLFSW